ncbi:MAG: hypothetical protein ACE5FW_01980 [Candidatus Aenigmatarchaeota archaeon]
MTRSIESLKASIKAYDRIFEVYGGEEKAPEGLKVPYRAMKERLDALKGKTEQYDSQRLAAR